MNMFNDDGVNYVFDGTAQIRNVPSLAKITPKILAVSCNKRLKELPNVKTLAEQGITAPGPWAAITANRSMTDSRRQEVAKLIEDELKIIGEEKVQQLSTLKPLVFTKQSLDSFYEKKSSAARAHLARYRTKIDADRGTTKK
jgi:tripartite-type tricarboxylate transporter receptor subunit TctC